VTPPSHSTDPASAPPAVRQTERAAAMRLVRGDGSQQLSLPYEYDVSPGIAAEPMAPPSLRIVGEADWPPDDLPDPLLWTAKIARAVAEVAIGARPPGQLTRHVERGELARIIRRGQAVSRHPSARMQRGVSRLRAVRAVRACHVAPGIVETSAVLVGGERAQAIAMRLEAVSGRWLATVVQLG
jgi:hypothetical protein